MSLAAAIAAAGSLETKKKIFQFMHGEWITCADLVKAGIICKSSARLNINQLVDVGYMEIDTSGNSHKYRAIAPIDAPLKLDMFVDESLAKNYAMRNRTAKSNSERRIEKEKKLNGIIKAVTGQWMDSTQISKIINVHITTVYKYMGYLMDMGAVKTAFDSKTRQNLYISTGDLPKIVLPKSKKEGCNNGMDNVMKIRRRESIRFVQDNLTETPESAKELHARIGLNINHLISLLPELHEAEGCKRIVFSKPNVRWTYKYYKTKDCKPFIVGELIKDHSDSRDGWKPSKMPTDNPMINALMGYTEFKPPKGRVIEESMPHIPVSKHRVYVAGSTLEMV